MISEHHRQDNEEPGCKFHLSLPFACCDEWLQDSRIDRIMAGWHPTSSYHFGLRRLSDAIGSRSVRLRMLNRLAMLAICQKAQITVLEHESTNHRQPEIPLADRRSWHFQAFPRGFNLKFLLPSPKLAAFPTRTFRTSTLHSAIHFGRHSGKLIRRSCSGLSIVWRFPVGRSWLRTVFRCSL